MTDARQEQALTELLDELARADARMTAPQRIEHLVMDQWENEAPARTTSDAILTSDGIGSALREQGFATYRRLLGLSGLAAAVILAIALNRWSSVPAGVPASVSNLHAGQQVQDAVISAPSPVAIATRPASPARTPRVARRLPVEPEREVVSFVPLSSTAQQDLSGSFQIARVRLPREVLADLGVMLDANRVGEPIEADVVFSEDGLARAIRLAPASWRSQ